MITAVYTVAKQLPMLKQFVLIANDNLKLNQKDKIGYIIKQERSMIDHELFLLWSERSDASN